MSSTDVVGSLVEDFNHFIDTIYHLVKTEHVRSEFMESLKKSLKINDVAEIIIKFFRDYFGGDAACILTYKRGQFNITKTWNLDMDIDKTDTDYWFRVLTEGRVILLEEVAEDLLAINIGLGRLKPKYIAYIPLVYQAHYVGIVILLSRTPFHKDFQSLESQNIISEATPFLYNALLMKRLELLAAIDELTGVLNRRFGIRRLNEEFERSKRHSLPLSVAMIDIDDFKKINDAYGHQCGDLVLKTLAELITQNIRVSDFVIRYGGEEFLVVIPGASSLDAMRLMDRLLNIVATFTVHYGGHEIHFTFSGGIATYPAENIKELSTLIQKADEALYQAKRTGKNQVIISG
jgi:diguanylate cyclase (GGDEF)-like protein